MNEFSARCVPLPIRVEKPQPNYLRDGAFIVVMLLAVLLFEIFSGNSGEVRTYNVPQSRVTDHRSNVSNFNLDQVLDGNIDDFIDAMIDLEQTKLLRAAIE